MPRKPEEAETDAVAGPGGARFEQLRHQPAAPGPGAGELIVACPPMRSGVNLSRIVRAAGCCGVRTMVVCGGGRIDPRIARDAVERIEIRRRRTLEPLLRRWKQEGVRLVGLEQTSGSVPLDRYDFVRRCVLVVGNERTGIEPDLLRWLDDVVEIPVFGRPFSHNVATAVAMTLYEYCRQHGRG